MTATVGIEEASSAGRKPGSDQVLFVSVKTAARMLSLGRTRLYELLDAGEIESVRFGGRRLISRASISAFAERLFEQK